jgi:hypothetical protein
MAKYISLTVRNIKEKSSAQDPNDNGQRFIFTQLVAW